MSQEFDSLVLDLVKGKGFYLHEYMFSFEKFEETLPDKNEFSSSLSGKEISDKEYQHVLRVWNKLVMKTIKYYHDLYLQYDVLLLGNVFEQFGNGCPEKFFLCSIHYLSAPALSWNAMLSMTKVELDLNTNIDMYLFFRY